MEVLKWLVGVACRWAVASGGGRTGNLRIDLEKN